MGKLKAAKLPRKIAGVKVPKAQRRGALAEFFASPDGRKLIAETLVVAGAAILGRESSPDSGVRKVLHDPAERLRDAKEGVVAAGSEAAHAAAESSARLGHAFAAAARAFRDALQSSPEPKPVRAKAAKTEPPAAPAAEPPPIKRPPRARTARPVRH